VLDLRDGLMRVRRNALDKAAKVLEMLGDEVQEAHSVTKPRGYAHDLPLRLQLNVADPQRDLKPGVGCERDRHLDEAASLADIRGSAPDDAMADPAYLD
jgi:hypothetical protein